MKRIHLTVTSMTILAAATALHGDVVHVPGNASSIQAAINMASSGDEIRVAPGTYYENIDMLGKSVTLVATGGPENTTIDATGQNDTAIRCDSAEGPGTVIRGFTVTGGTGDTTTWGAFTPLGGGMYCRSSSPTVDNCVFIDNVANGGGGMYLFAASPEVINSQFISNQAVGTGAFGSGGGGVGAVSSSPVFEHCSFVGNTSTAEGGGMIISVSNPVLTNCEFIGNSTVLFGGAMRNVTSNLEITNCTFTENTALTGGAMMNVSDGATVNIDVSNCIISNNGNSELHSGTGAITTVHDSIVSGGWAVGSGVINADPGFVRRPNSGNDGEWGTDDDDWGNLCPANGSPAIDRGDTDMLPSDILVDLDGNDRVMGDSVDIGAYEAIGDVVIVDDCPGDVVPPDGNSVVNMDDVLAVINAWGQPCNDCPEDISPDNGDGTFGNNVVNIDDVLTVIDMFGSCP